MGATISQRHRAKMKHQIAYERHLHTVENHINNIAKSVSDAAFALSDAEANLMKIAMRSHTAIRMYDQGDTVLQIRIVLSNMLEQMSYDSYFTQGIGEWFARDVMEKIRDKKFKELKTIMDFDMHSGGGSK